MYEDIEDFIGKIFTEININNDENEIIFVTDNGEKYKMFHEQDCCENVCIEDINGDISDLLNSPITMAEQVSNSEDEPIVDWEESYTWTYQKIATVKGYVTLRWYGISNGYYSESVEIEKI